MKSLGIRLADEVCYLNQLGVITNDERVEYANLIGLSMRPGYDHYIGLLQEKLKQKAKTCPDCHSDYLDAALILFEQEN